MKTLEQFADKTALLPNVVAETVLGKTEHSLSESDVEWFVEHVKAHTLYLYNTDSGWQKKLESEAGRDHLYVFVEHWLDSYQQNPERFRERHPIVQLQLGEFFVGCGAHLHP